jgi:uncharacterized RDD family membrane protein YckC
MSDVRTNTVIIRTPEGIAFSFLLASPITRFLAYVVDLACLAALAMVVRIFMNLLAVVSTDFGGAASVLVFFVLQIGYGLTCEWCWRGQTVGKRLLRLRVMDAQGLRVQFSQIAIRNLLRAVDMIPAFYLLGGIVAWFSPKSQRLGDLAASTIVIRTPKIEQPDLDQVAPGKFNSLRQHPHLEARLRQKISPIEARLALQEFPPDAVEGISDEQYLRNVVDVVFRPRAVKL